MGNKYNICLGCMSPKTEEGRCPICGYSEKMPYLPSYLAPGTILNERYLVGKIINYNGEGATYIGYDTVTDKKIWVREYMPDTLCSRKKGSCELVASQNHIAQYKTELSEFIDLNKTLAKMRTLSHINPALDVFNENNTVYAVFDCIEGKTLKQYLQDNAGELSWDEAKKLFPSIFTTLSLVHNTGIVHRGISPETIYITKNGEMKLLGFCIASERTANTELAPELYSGYAAPEQYSSSSWHGTWTDVYAISAVLYRVLTGCMPIEALSRVGNDNLIEPAEINNNVPKNVSKVIMQGLKLDGDARIQTVTELVTKLFEQPEYLQSKTKTTTIPIQKVKIPIEKSDKKKDTNTQLRTLIIIFVATLSILALGLIIALILIGRTDNTNVNKFAINNSDLKTGEEDNINTEFKIDEDKQIVKADGAIASQDTGVMNDIITENQLYEIPNFIGKNFELIKNSETYKDWLIFVPIIEYNDNVPKNEIFEQNIVEGKFVSSGQQIELKVSKGPSQVIIPQYYGKMEKEYLSLLDAAGIKYEVVPKKDKGFTDGYVITTSKDPDTKIDVSKGEILKVIVCDN